MQAPPTALHITAANPFTGTPCTFVSYNAPTLSWSSLRQSQHPVELRKSNMSAPGKSFVRGLIALTLLCAALFITRNAAAQGTSGTVPDPISARELENYCDRLHLSDQQLQAVQAFHDAYRAEFTALREGDIEKLLKETRSLQGMGFAALQQRAEVEKSLKALDQVMDKIRAVDNRLFDQVQTVLTEEQITQMPRVRQARERKRYQSGLTRMASMMNPAVQIDLSDVISDMDLPPAAVQTLDPMLVQYENSLTSAARKMHEASTNMIMDMLDKLADLGINEESMRDPQRGAQMWTSIRDVWGELNTKLQEKAAAISELNRKTVRNFGAVLPEDSAHKLHDEYYQRAYREATGGSNATGRSFTDALKLDDLSSEQRQTITAMSAEYRSSSDRLTDEAADLIDENRRTRTFFDFNSDRQREYQEKLVKLQEKRTTLSSTTVANLKAALGPELSERLDQQLAKAESGDAQTVETRIATAGGPGMGQIAVTRSSIALSSDASPNADPFLPGPITGRSAELFAKQLNFTGDNKVIYDSLFEDYKERWETIQKSDIQPVLDASAALWTVNGPGGQVTAPTAEAVENIFDLRKKALQAILQMDSSFFDDVKTTLLSDEDDAALQRVRQARLREVYNRGPGMGDMFANFGPRGPGSGGGPRGGGGGGGGDRPSGGGGPRSFGFFGSSSEESSLDLTVIIEGITLEPEQRNAVDPALKEYETAVTEAFRKQYEASLRMQQAMDKAMAQSMQVNADGTRTTQMGAGFREAMEGDGRASRETRRDLANLNRTSRDKIAALLPPSAQLEFKQAYNKKAFGWVYRDAQAAGPHLTAAMELDDLSPQQRSTVSDLSTEYRCAYDTLCEKMVDLQAGAPDTSGPPAPGEVRDWQAMQDRQRELEKLTFDRNDLSDKTVSRLKVVLTDEQVQRLGGLSAHAQTQ